MDAFAQAPSVLERDTYLRIYFSCRPKPVDGRYVSYSAYVDIDKNDFSILHVSERPVLALGERGTFDEFGVYPFLAIDFGGEVHAYYGGWMRCTSVSNCVNHLEECDDLFPTKLSKRVDLHAYAVKLQNRATSFELWQDGHLAGVLAAYMDTDIVFISHICVLSEAPPGSGRTLLEALFEEAERFGKHGIE